MLLNEVLAESTHVSLNHMQDETAIDIDALTASLQRALHLAEDLKLRVKEIY